MRKLIYVIMAAVISAVALNSCIDDSFSSSSADKLTFSVDTLCFDTVFTDQGTPTARMKVYNRNSKSLKISIIRMANADSYFQLNVDGESGTEFKDVEIRGGDSIYVFVECLLPATAGNEPYLVADKIDFVTNGNLQEVAVEAYGQNVNRLRALRVEQDMTLTADRPYVVTDSLIVAPGATLTLQPGVKLLFHDKASMRIYGCLKANGTPDKKIDLRGDRLDNVLPDVSYDIMSGQWGGVSIAPESFDNELTCVNMRSSSDGLSVDSCGNTSRRKLLIANSWLHNSQASALKVSHARVEAYGSCFSEAALNVVDLRGGVYDFTQCTFSNYYLFSAPTEPIVGLYDIKATDDNPTATMQAEFKNCIIYGLSSDLNVGDFTDTAIYLRNTLLHSEGTDDDHFIECIWNADPLFYTIREDYYFNYRLKPDSPAIGAGNPAFVTGGCAYDMDGIYRLSSARPDLGAYCFVAPTE